MVLARSVGTALSLGLLAIACAPKTYGRLAVATECPGLKNPLGTLHLKISDSPGEPIWLRTWHYEADGTVREARQWPMVIVTDRATGERIVGRADRYGSWAAKLKPREYVAKVAAQGFATSEAIVMVRPGCDTFVRIRMELAPIVTY